MKSSEIIVPYPQEGQCKCVAVEERQTPSQPGRYLFFSEVNGSNKGQKARVYDVMKTYG